MHTRFFICVLLVVAGVTVNRTAAVEFASDDLIGVETKCRADSVTVGQRFVVSHTFSYPDTLAMQPVTGLKADKKSRVVSLQWSDRSSRGAITRTARIEMMSLDLAEARVPQQEFDFLTPGGDTLRVVTEEIVLPVRSLTAASQAPRPLKEQWEAPRNWWPWIIAGLAALVVAAIGILIWRRRARREPEPVFVPSLPPDHVALSELTRIEQLNLIDRGEFKQYYTLVVDAVRHYVEARFEVEAMDRTTLELLSDLDRKAANIEGLEPLLGEADLVKFAKHVPQVSDAAEAMHTSREIVIRTTPRSVPGETNENDKVAGAEGTV